MVEQLDLNSVVVLLRVAEAGSFTVAAARLDMPKSTVSRKVAELEASLGTQLIRRTTRKLALTDAGAAFVEQAEAAMALLDAAQMAVSELQREPRGRLRVTATPQMGQRFLAPLVVEFMEQYPAVQVTLHLTDRHVDLLSERFDVALRAGVLPDSSLVAHRVALGSVSLVASPRYLAARGTPQTPSDLATHDLLLFASAGGQARRVWTLGRGDAAREVAVSGRLVADDWSVLTQAAVRGLGIARVPNILMQDELRRGDVVTVLDDFASEDMPLNLVHLGGRYVTSRTRAFIDFVRPRLADVLMPPPQAP